MMCRSLFSGNGESTNDKPSPKTHRNSITEPRGPESTAREDTDMHRRDPDEPTNNLTGTAQTTIQIKT